MEIILGVVVVIAVLWLIFHPSIIFDFIGGIFRMVFNVVGGCFGCLITVVIVTVVLYFLLGYGLSSL